MIDTLFEYSNYNNKILIDLNYQISKQNLTENY